MGGIILGQKVVLSKLEGSNQYSFSTFFNSVERFDYFIRSLSAFLLYSASDLKLTWTIPVKNLLFSFPHLSGEGGKELRIDEPGKKI